LPNDRKSTQRERLLNGMIHIAANEGYGAATIARVVARAGVSRPTFYDYFADKDTCFLAAEADIQQRLLDNVGAAVHSQAPEHAVRATVEALIGFAGSQPAMARFLMNETMAGGPRTLDARDEGIARIAQIIEQAHEQVAAQTAIPDLSPPMLLGAVYRLLASRLRRGERSLSGLLEDLPGWIESYERPAGEHRWRTLQPAPPPRALALPAPTPPRVPPALAPGRPRIGEEAVAENHRQRIMFATAQLVQEQGYTATTIAEITKLAGVDGRAFYSLFADKEDAFMAVHELGFHRTMAVTAGAFFASASWPERMWEALRALTQWLQSHPTIAHVGFVESYAVGSDAVQRAEDSLIAFTIFLQEGYQHEPRRDTPPTRVGLEAIVTSAFEVLHYQLRRSTTPEMAGLLPHLIHLSLTPFLGPAEADRLIDQQLSAP
jgi:AcrR family transcriptional regulator